MAATDFLNDRQTEVLEWIAAGCPARDWPDYTHRLSARALVSRGLVTIRGHGPTWTSTITDSGRAYLSGDVGQASCPDEAQSGTEKEPEANRVSSQALLEALMVGDGTVTVRSPSPSLRAAYRRAISALQQQDLPDGQRVTHRGRDRGDLVIRLAPKARGQAPDEVPVPTASNPRHAVVQDLRPRLEEVDVGGPSHERLLLLVQALADESTRRGYTCTVPDEGAVLVVTISGVDAPFLVREEKDAVRLVPEDERRKVKYEWQRAPMRKAQQWSGRLVLSLDNGSWRKPWWADRKRWSLESRLPLALAAAEEWAEGVRQQRDAADRAKHRRIEAWEEAVPKARAAYVDAVNRDRLAAQRDAFGAADDLRAYAAAIEGRLPSLSEDRRAGAREWASWIRAEADRVDPLLSPEQLFFERPQDAPVTEVDRFMPSGMTSAGPPD